MSLDFKGLRTLLKTVFPFYLVSEMAKTFAWRGFCNWLTIWFVGRRAKPLKIIVTFPEMAPGYTNIKKFSG